MAKRNHKKGITPLIATFILISFAVAVGVVVTNFARAEVEEEAQCPIDINLEFIKENSPSLCYNQATKNIEFTIGNGINIKVQGLIVNIIGTTKATTLELNHAQLPRGGIFQGKIEFDTAIAGQIRQLKITPKVFFNEDQEGICVEQALVVEKVNPC